MALNPRIWYPIAAIACLVNVVSVAFAVIPGEPWHATAHAALAVAFGVWAQRLRARRQAAVLPPGDESEIAAIWDEVGDLKRELSELQERMDFAERLLSQAREMERLPDRKASE